MQIAATTSHAALTASPRLSATIENATARRRATGIHKSFVCGALELLMVFMDVLPDCRKPTQTTFTLAGTLIEARVYWPGSFPSVHAKVRLFHFARLGTHYSSA